MSYRNALEVATVAAKDNTTGPRGESVFVDQDGGMFATNGWCLAYYKPYGAELSNAPRKASFLLSSIQALKRALGKKDVPIFLKDKYAAYAGQAIVELEKGEDYFDFTRIRPTDGSKVAVKLHPKGLELVAQVLRRQGFGSLTMEVRDDENNVPVRFLAENDEGRAEIFLMPLVR